MEMISQSKSARNKAKKRAKKEARKALKPKMLHQGAQCVFPARNLRAAFSLAEKERYPDLLGVTVWTSIKGERPQVIEVRALRKIIQHMNNNLDKYQNDVRVKLTPTTVWVGDGRHSSTISL